ncbi:MAG: adenylate/guanylate cyclase domain-containing protein [Bacteroidota bacterium]
MSRTTVRSWLARALISFSVAILVVGLTVESVFHLGLFQRLELSSIDYRFLYRGVNTEVKDSSDVVIVDIDEEAFRSLPAGPLPWPREYYAHLIRNLHRAGARAVGIDLIFDSPDNHGPAGDSTFRAALKETNNVILAGKREQDSERFERRLLRNDFGNIFFNVDSAVGLVNIQSDADGIYRLYTPFYRMDVADDSALSVPTFAFAVLNRVFGLPPLTAAVNSGKSFFYAGRIIPKYDPTAMMINFYGPNGTFRHYHFHDVIDDRSFTTVDEMSTGAETNTFDDPDYGYLYDGTFKNKIVLVGVTLPEYKDLFPVSIGRGRQRGDNQMYGVEVHANVIENVLRNDFLRVQGPLTEVPEVILLVMLTFLLTASLRDRARGRQVLMELVSFLFIAGFLCLVLWAALWLFVHRSFVMSIVSPSAAIIAGYVGSTAYNLVTERRQRALIKTMFSTYVNPSVVDELILNPGKLTLGGQRKELTVLFSDIEGFTTIAQSMEPERLVKLLNEYLDAMSAAIFEHDGTLDKYEGDAIMAFWGAPIPQWDHALRACRSALVMRDRLKDLNARWEESGRPPFHMRQGINTGEMIVGNMGSTGKFAYTVIGDSVNLASRLEGANKEYRTSIMVSKRTYDLVKGEIVGRELDLLTVKGRNEPAAVYELIAQRGGLEDPEVFRFLNQYEEGMRLYHEHQWELARAAFERALQLRANDYPTLLHRDRAARFAQMRPGECSDIVVLQEK